MSEQPPKIFNHNRWIEQRNKAAAGFADFAFLKQLATVRLAEPVSYTHLTLPTKRIV